MFSEVVFGLPYTCFGIITVVQAWDNTGAGDDGSQDRATMKRKTRARQGKKVCRGRNGEGEGYR